MNDHTEITLNSVAKSFEFERISREIDEIEDIEVLKNISKSYVKLHMKQQEVLLDLNVNLLDK